MTHNLTHLDHLFEGTEMMRPVDIEIMLHYYSRVDDWHGGNWNTSQSDWLLSLYRRNLLEPIPQIPDGPKNNMYRITDRGRAYVMGLCAMPLPICKWVIPKSSGEVPDVMEPEARAAMREVPMAGNG